MPAREQEFGADAIRLVLVAHEAHIAGCIRAAPTPTQVTLNVEWTVATTGRVTNVVVVQAAPDVPQVVQDCLVAEIGTWAFPPPDRSTQVVYPFRFSSLSSVPPPATHEPSPVPGTGDQAVRALGGRW